MSGFGSMQNAVAEWGIFVLDKMIGGFSVQNVDFKEQRMVDDWWFSVVENDGEKFEHQKLNHQPHNFLKRI